MNVNNATLVLFAIPFVCIIVVAITQFRDEMFKKKFIIERRSRNSNNPGHNRRYSDRKNDEAQSASTSPSEERAPEPSKTRDTGVFETSGSGR